MQGEVLDYMDAIQIMNTGGALQMTSVVRKWSGIPALNISAAALALMVVVGAPTAARADEAAAKSLLKAMSDYLAAQKAISFSYDSNLEIVTKDKQKLALASSGTVTLDRPDKARVTRHGGFADIEAVFDGKTLTLLGKNTNLYAQVDVPGTIDHLIDELRDKYHRPVPGADLLLSNVYEQLMASGHERKGSRQWRNRRR